MWTGIFWRNINGYHFVTLSLLILNAHMVERLELKSLDFAIVPAIRTCHQASSETPEEGR